MRILACDAGSSSYKAALYEVYAHPKVTPPAPLWSGEVTWQNIPGPVSVYDLKAGTQAEQTTDNVQSQEAAVEELFRRPFASHGVGVNSYQPIEVAVHRIVHGGRLAPQGAIVTSEVKSAIKAASALAPEHNPLALAGMDVVERVFGLIRQVVVFDSGFHATLSEPTYTYAVPLSWRDDWGVRRLGFHGISHRYVSERCAQLLGKDVGQLKIVSCHLGNGCSLAAIDRGRSIDTTMGWTPMEGLVMGERSGDIDPGVLLDLIDCGRFTAAELRRALNEESGLKGISGISGDMRDIVLGMENSQPRAKLAFEVYAHRLCRGIGSMVASLGGLDALAFTGGVGENVPALREAACSTLSYYGLKIDPERNWNLSPDARLSEANQQPAIFVIKSEERWELARECFGILHEGSRA